MTTVAPAATTPARVEDPQDGVEEAWRVMQPLLDAPPPVHWHDPWVAS